MKLTMFPEQNAVYAENQPEIIRHAQVDAYRAGAEWMREEAARVCMRTHAFRQDFYHEAETDAIRSIPIKEKP